MEPAHSAKNCPSFIKYTRSSERQHNIVISFTLFLHTLAATSRHGEINRRLDCGVDPLRADGVFSITFVVRSTRVSEVDHSIFGEIAVLGTLSDTIWCQYVVISSKTLHEPWFNYSVSKLELKVLHSVERIVWRPRSHRVVLACVFGCVRW